MLITVQPNPSWQLSLAQLSPSLYFDVSIYIKLRLCFSNKLAMNSICQHCGKTFADKHKLAVHSLNHAKDEIKCHICEKICIGNKKFQNHINIQNFRKTTQFSCK